MLSSRSRTYVAPSRLNSAAADTQRPSQAKDVRRGVLELLTGIRIDVERLDQLSREQADFFADPRVSDVVQGLHEYVRVSPLVDLRLTHEVFLQ